MKTRLLLVLSLLGASVAFGLYRVIAWYAPWYALWLYATELELAESSTLIALACLVVLTLRQTGFDFSCLNLPVFHRRMTSRLAWVFTALGCVGAALFCLFSATQFTQYDQMIPYYGAINARLWQFLYALGNPNNSLRGYGEFSFLVWGLTLLSFTLSKGLAVSVRRFAIPSLLFLSLCVMAATPMQMITRIATFATWTFWNYYIFNNWSLFAVSLVLALFCLIPTRTTLGMGGPDGPPPPGLQRALAGGIGSGGFQTHYEFESLSKSIARWACWSKARGHVTTSRPRRETCDPTCSALVRRPRAPVAGF